MTPRKRKATGPVEGPPAKRASKGRAVKKQDDPVWATENEKSHMVNEDLHAKFCDPTTYENWTREDWEEIHDCLPENVLFNDDGYSVQINYFKYDPDWRRLVREFQEDLGAGRYEPQWQEEAAQAMEERAAGKFDKYKEDQYEAFWGQKQTLKRDDYAGESAKIKLADLVEAGRIRLGDDFSYRRAFDKKGDNVEGKWMIEKELRIVAIEGTSLTVAIPPGQLKYARLQHQTEANGHSETEPVDIEKEGETVKTVDDQTNGVEAENDENDAAEKTVNDQTDGMKDQSERNQGSFHAPEDPVKRGANPDGDSDLSESDHRPLKDPEHIMSASNRNDIPAVSGTQEAVSGQPNGLSREDITAVVSPTNGIAEVDTGQGSRSSSDTGTELSLVKEHAQVDGADTNMADSDSKTVAADGGQTSPVDQEKGDIDPQTGCILHQVRTVKSLADKIVEIDGRIHPKDVPILSNWRTIRLQRNNQDLGSLFDIREEYYVWKSPTIVKTPKEGRGKRKVQVDDEDSDDFLQPAKGKGKPATTKRGSQPTQRPKKETKATKDIEKAQVEDQEEKAEIEDSDDDEDVAVEGDNDGDFVTTKPRSRKPKSKTRAKKGSGRARGGVANEDGGSAEDGNVKGNKRKGGEPEVEHIHFCQNCGAGFTRAWSVRNHIAKHCKKVPSD